jgi:putative membrane protein
MIIWVVSNAIAIAVAAWLLDGIRFEGPSSGQAEFTDKVVPVLLVSVILGLVTVFVEPVAKFFSFPFIIVTIGLFLLVINALMLMLTGWIAGKLEIGFTVDGFWAALVGSIIITVVTGFLELAAPEDD